MTKTTRILSRTSEAVQRTAQIMVRMLAGRGTKIPVFTETVLVPKYASVEARRHYYQLQRQPGKQYRSIFRERKEA